MTNGEKHKTVWERVKAFEKFCAKNCRKDLKGYCDLCELKGFSQCQLHWLDLEAEEEKPLPCIYCKGDMLYFRNVNGSFFRCAYCNHQTRGFENYEIAVCEYNRVAKAVKESEAK